jgi:hypothetical protein
LFRQKMAKIFIKALVPWSPERYKKHGLYSLNYTPKTC